MVEGGISPCRGVVALLASLREVRSRVIGIRRALVILQMAGDASRTAQIVVVVDVTLGTLPRRNSMRPGQRKAGGGMVEFRVQPG